MDLAAKHVRATVPPIIAAAMLSRNPDSTNTSASSTNPPFQSSGRSPASRPARRLPRSDAQQRKAQQQPEQAPECTPMVTEMQPEALQARALLEAGNGELVGGNDAKAGERDCHGRR